MVGYSSQARAIPHPAEEMLKRETFGTQELPIGEVSVLAVRAMTPADMEALETPRWQRAEVRGETTPMPSVAALRARHHEIARLLACGVATAKVAELMDVTVAHVNLLQKTPAFRGLLFYYMKARDEKVMALADQVKMAAGLAMQRTFEYLERPASDMSPQVLRKMTMDLLDRAGHAPVQRNMNMNVGVTADDIRAIRERRSARFAKVDQAGSADTDVAAAGGLLDHAALPGAPAEERSEEGWAAFPEESGEGTLPAFPGE